LLFRLMQTTSQGTAFRLSEGQFLFQLEQFILQRFMVLRMQALLSGQTHPQFLVFLLQDSSLAVFRPCHPLLSFRLGLP
jgi:hypothetical protein